MPVFLRIYVDHPVPWQNMADPFPAHRAYAPEPGRAAAPVELAGILVGGLQILGSFRHLLRPEGADSALYVHAHRPLDGEAEFGHRVDEGGLAGEQAVVGGAQIAGLNEWHCGIDAAVVFRLNAEIVELPDGIDHHRGCAGMIVGQAGGAQEGHLGAELAGQVGDLLIIGGDHNSAEAACRSGRLNGVGEHGLAAEGADILAGNALAAAPGRNDGDGHGALSLRDGIWHPRPDNC